MRILVPLDGSTRSEFALSSAAYLARRMAPPANIVLLHVVVLTPTATAGVMPTYASVINQAIEAGNDYLHGVALRDSLAKLTVIQRTVAGVVSVPKTILAEAGELQADLIVMSSHGRSGFAEMALGSVAHELARTSEIPILIQRMEESFDRPFDLYQPFTALVALDGSRNAEVTLPIISEITRALHGIVRLFSVLSCQNGDHTNGRAVFDAMEEYLDEMQHRVQRLGVPTETSLVWGDPAEQIVHICQTETHGCDLIAIATCSCTSMERLVMGSVAERIIHQAHCPLLIMRPRGEMIGHMGGDSIEVTR